MLTWQMTSTRVSSSLRVSGEMIDTAREVAMRIDEYTPIRNAFFWAVIVGGIGAMLGGIAIGLLIGHHVFWSLASVVFAIFFLVWADLYYQKGINLLWESLGGAFLSEKYPAGKSLEK